MWSIAISKTVYSVPSNNVERMIGSIAPAIANTGKTKDCIIVYRVQVGAIKDLSARGWKFLRGWGRDRVDGASNTKATHSHSSELE